MKFRFNFKYLSYPLLTNFVVVKKCAHLQEDLYQRHQSVIGPSVAGDGPLENNNQELVVNRYFSQNNLVFYSSSFRISKHF